MGQNHLNMNISCNLLTTVFKSEKLNGCLGRPQDHFADWELCFTVTAQDHKRRSDHVTLDQGKIKIQYSDYGFH